MHSLSLYLEIKPNFIKRSPPGMVGWPLKKQSKRHFMPYHAMLCFFYAMFYHFVPFYTMLSHSMLCHVIPFYASLCHVIPFYAIFCRLMPCYAILCHLMQCSSILGHLCHLRPCYTMLCHLCHFCQVMPCCPISCQFLPSTDAYGFGIYSDPPSCSWYTRTPLLNLQVVHFQVIIFLSNSFNFVLVCKNFCNVRVLAIINVLTRTSRSQ